MRQTLVIAALVVLGCSPVRSADPGDDDAPAEFVAAPPGAPTAPAGATAPPTVRPTAAGVEVLGLISTPNPCHDVRASVVGNAGEITVTVTAAARDVTCITVIGSFAYRVSEDVPAGEYHVRVVHAYEGSGWPDEVAFDGSITVP